MKCPCKDCLTLPICKTMDLHHLANKCSLMNTYLGVKIIRRSYSNEKIVNIYSNLKPSLHKFRMNKVKKYILHTHTLNYYGGK